MSNKWTKVVAAGSFLAANYWILIIAAVLIGLFFLVSQIESCNGKKFQKKTEEQKATINQEKGAANQIEEQRDDQKQNINQADAAANVAAGNFNAVQHTDSSTRDKNWSRAKREWCKDHQSDSKCRAAPE